MYPIIEPYHLFSDPIRYFNAMIDDIENACHYIYIETYRVGNDIIGARFRDALIKKVKKGIEVKLLVDAWGGVSVSRNFFDELVRHGGEVRFFEKIRLNFDMFTCSHRRNHRKIMIIDDEITYIGSSNLTGYNLNWRESVLRMKSPISLAFKKVFKQDFSIYNKYVFTKSNYIRLIRHADFEIVRDMPSITKQRIMRRFILLTNKADHSVTIVTPYFLPGYKLRRALTNASARGVDVKVLIPKRSDVGLVDILRNKYLGNMHLKGVQFLLYLPHNLHAKFMLVDESVFAIGSSNFDYQSFRYMHEIMLIGNDGSIAEQINRHIAVSLEQTEPFNYDRWRHRPLINRLFEYMLLPFRHLL